VPLHALPQSAQTAVTSAPRRSEGAQSRGLAPERACAELMVKSSNIASHCEFGRALANELGIFRAECELLSSACL